MPFCRLHENAVETTKISRLLIAIENGEANKYAGKSLDEINIEGKPFSDPFMTYRVDGLTQINSITEKQIRSPQNPKTRRFSSSIGDMFNVPLLIATPLRGENHPQVLFFRPQGL